EAWVCYTKASELATPLLARRAPMDRNEDYRFLDRLRGDSHHGVGRGLNLNAVCDWSEMERGFAGEPATTAFPWASTNTPSPSAGRRQDRGRGRARARRARGHATRPRAPTTRDAQSFALSLAIARSTLGRFLASCTKRGNRLARLWFCQPCCGS